MVVVVGRVDEVVVDAGVLVVVVGGALGERRAASGLRSRKIRAALSSRYTTDCDPA